MSNFPNKLFNKFSKNSDSAIHIVNNKQINKIGKSKEINDEEEKEYINNLSFLKEFGSNKISDMQSRNINSKSINNSFNNMSHNESEMNLIKPINQKNDFLQILNKNSKINKNENEIITNLKKISVNFQNNSNKEKIKLNDTNSVNKSISSADSDDMSKCSENYTSKALKISDRSINNKKFETSKNNTLINNSNKEIKKSYEEDKNINNIKKIKPIQDLMNHPRKASQIDNESSPNDSDKEKKRKNYRKLSKREKICDSDSEDNGSDNEKDIKWIILPDNIYKRILDIIMAGIILYSAIILPYKIAFEDSDDNSDEILDNIFNLFLVIDIIVNFFSAYMDSEDNLVKNSSKIIWNYLKGWFIVDLVSVMPFNYITDSPETTKFNALARLSRLPKLYRLIRLAKLVRMFKILKKGNVNKVAKFFLEKLKVNANIERLIYFILAFLLLNHLAACIWYFVAKLEDLNPDCWVTRLGYIDASNAEIYIVSFYWTLTTVTTVGYGDVNAGTTVERIYNLFIMSFGVLMYSFAIGSLSSIVSTLDAKTSEMNQKLQILSSIKKEFNLDQEIYDKVRKVIKYDLSRNQKDKMNFLQELPNKLRIELSQIMHDSVIQKMYFFKDQPSDFIAYVAPLLKPVKFSQNDFLYKEDDMIDEMYFVSKGTVSFCLGKDYLDKEIKEIKKHNNFGEIEMCLNEKLTYNVKVKSRTCELFVLKKNDFLRLSVNFKEFIEKFLQRSLMIYLRFNDEKRKITKQISEQKKLIHNSNNKTTAAKEELEIVDEHIEDEVSEVHDIFNDIESENSISVSSSKTSSSSEHIDKNDIKTINNINNEVIENKENGNDKQNVIHNNIVNVNANPILNEPIVERLSFAFPITNNNIDDIDQLLIQKIKKRAASTNKNITKEVEGNSLNQFKTLNNPFIRKNIDRNSLFTGRNFQKNCFSASPVKIVSPKNKNEIPDSENVEKLKIQMNRKFYKKVEKIIDFLVKNKIESEFSPDDPNNPLNLLKILKNIQDLSERNEIIDKIEIIVSEIFTRTDKK